MAGLGSGIDSTKGVENPWNRGAIEARGVGSPL
jgi:hypothetical protein